MLCTPLYTLVYKITHIAEKGNRELFVVRPSSFVRG
jgi:hypothetical protein